LLGGGHLYLLAVKTAILNLSKDDEGDAPGRREPADAGRGDEFWQYEVTQDPNSRHDQA
jgi:hypothetical protein